MHTTPLLLLLLLPLLATSGPLVIQTQDHDQVPPDTLRLVHVLYRHGARTPIETYPTNPNPDAWPQGFGQLTNEGKQNQLKLGRFLRRRYDGFLPALYHLNYMHVESTDVDRTLMSAQTNLAGLFPPQGDDVWDAELPWQPIPVHTVPVEDDLKLKSYQSCAAFTQERARVFASSEMAAVDAANAGLYSYLSEHSGLQIYNVDTVGDLYDTFLIDWSHNLTLPAWAQDVPSGYDAPAFPDLMKPLRDLQFGLYGATELQRRLGGGPVLKDMLEHMQYSVDGHLSPPNRKMFAYSAHDNNVACLLTTLQLYNGIAPPLASCVLVELHSEPELGHTVQLFYRNDTSVEPYPLQLPGCDLSCPWQTFLQLTAAVVPDDVEAECSVGGYVGSNKHQQ